MISDKHKDLIDRYSDDRITPQEFKVLQDALRNNSELRQYLIEYRSMETGLGKLSPFIEPSDDDLIQSLNRSKKRFLSLAVIAACSILLLASLVNIRQANGALADPKDDAIGQITKVLNVANQAISKGIISPGQLRFEEGLVEIEFFSGARIIAKGPANLDLISSSEISCQEGTIRGYAPPHARGFKIRSQQMELVDIGTEFGVSVSPDLGAHVQVFDGEVEIYKPNQGANSEPRLLKAGDAITIGNDGASRVVEASSSFPAFDEVAQQALEQSNTRLASWIGWKNQIQSDPSLVAYFDFDTHITEPLTIIGCDSVEGRWPEKTALGFNSLADRVLVDLPEKMGEYSIAAWVRIDANPNRMQSILMTEGWPNNRIHWQTSAKGQLILDSKYADRGRARHVSPPVLKPRRIGQWSHLVSVRTKKGARHYWNGKKVSEQKLRKIRPVQFGSAQIGNWVTEDSSPSSIRNLIGRIDEIIIWKKALSDAEISEIYSKTQP